MIEDSPIVEDIRRIRCALSAQFDHDVVKYIDFLTEGTSGKADRVKLPSESPPNKAQDTYDND